MEAGVGEKRVSARVVYLMFGAFLASPIVGYPGGLFVWQIILPFVVAAHYRMVLTVLSRRPILAVFLVYSFLHTWLLAAFGDFGLFEAFQRLLLFVVVVATFCIVYQYSLGDDPRKRDDIAARVENYLYRIRNNEHMRTFVHRRDEPDRTMMLIGLDEHEAKDAIVKALWDRAAKEAGAEGLDIQIRDLKNMKTNKQMAAQLLTASRELLATLRQTVDDKVLASLVDMGTVPVPGTKLAGPIRWQAVFFIGPAGSGKSFVKTKKYLRHLDFKEVDPDEIKKSHPDYDPEKPFELHGWSKQIADAQLKKLMTDGSGSPVIVDGTGRNWKGVAKKMRMAEANGYRTHLVYVYVPFEVSIWRNRNRPRFVPEDVIMEQSGKIDQSYKQLKSIADKAKVVLNYEKAEQKLAQEDIELYPVPQPVRPPRPGDPNYGEVQDAQRAASEIVKAARDLMAATNLRKSQKA